MRDHDYWLKVSGLVEQMERVGRPGQAALVKIDGLRDNENIYTVLLDGALEDGRSID